jgi:hypothetical protein
MASNFLAAHRTAICHCAVPNLTVHSYADFRTAYSACRKTIARQIGPELPIALAADRALLI